jgi:hypothetical protein
MSIVLRLQALMGLNDIAATHRIAAALAYEYGDDGARRIINGADDVKAAAQTALDAAELRFDSNWDVAVIENRPRARLAFRDRALLDPERVRAAAHDIFRSDAEIYRTPGLDDGVLYLLVPRAAFWRAEYWLDWHHLWENPRRC